MSRKLLGIEYIDTGAMYRAAAYKALSCGVPVSDDEAVGEMLSGTEIDFVQGNIILDGENVNDKVRTLEDIEGGFTRFRNWSAAETSWWRFSAESLRQRASSWTAEISVQTFFPALPISFM